MPPENSARVKLSKDGTGLTMNWKAVATIVGLTIAATSAWLNLKFDVLVIKTDMAEMKTQMKTISEQLPPKIKSLALAKSEVP